MSEHKRNPHAEGYVIGSGKTPPVQVAGDLALSVEPSEEWLAANPPDPAFSPG